MKSHRMFLLLIGALMVGATLVPATASASIEWTKNGIPITTTQTIELDGAIKTESEAGGIECETQGIVKLFPGKAGEITSIQLNQCKTHGLLKTMGGCELEAAAADGLPWSVTNTGPEGIEVGDAGFTFELNEAEGCMFGSEYVVKPSPFTFVTYSPTNINNLQIGRWNSNLGEVADEVEVNFEVLTGLSGKFAVSPSGYGVGVQDGYPEWTKEGESLEKTEHIELAGNMRVNSELGGFTCSASMDATVYQERFGAEVTSVDLKYCNTIGHLYYPYGCQIQALEASLPWEIRTTYEGVRIPDLRLIGEVSGAGCQLGTFPYEVQGEAYLTADDMNSISMFTPKGVVETTIGMANLSSYKGLSLTPANTYGIE